MVCVKIVLALVLNSVFANRGIRGSDRPVAQEFDDSLTHDGTQDLNPLMSSGFLQSDVNESELRKDASLSSRLGNPCANLQEPNNNALIFPELWERCEPNGSLDAETPATVVDGDAVESEVDSQMQIDMLSGDDGYSFPDDFLVNFRDGAYSLGSDEFTQYDSAGSIAELTSVERDFGMDKIAKIHDDSLTHDDSDTLFWDNGLGR